MGRVWRMSDDVLELDGTPPPTPTSRRGSRWTRGRTAVVAGALLLALAVGLAFILWPRPEPEPEVLGLQDGPVEAWRSDSQYDHPLFGAELPGDRFVTAIRADSEDDVTVHARETATGATVWKRNLGDRAEPYISLKDLPGTPWLAVVLRGEALLLDKETGEEHRRLALPTFEMVEVDNTDGEPFEVPAGEVRVFSSDQGTIFVSAVRFDVQPETAGGVSVGGHREELTAYDSDDLDTPLWTRKLPVPASGGSFSLGYGEVLESRGHVFFPAPGLGLAGPDEGSLSFTSALDLADGSDVPWWPSVGGVSVVDGVALVAETGSVAAIDVETGEELWRSDPGNWGTLTDGESLYLLPRSGGDLQRVDPGTGAVRWSTEVPISIDAGWDGSTPGKFWHGDPLIQLSRGSLGSTLVRFDAATGREVMRVDFDVAPSALRVLAGEGQLVVLLTREHDRGDHLQLITDRVLAVDPDTGEVRWDRTFDAEASVVGRHLAVTDDDWSVIFYR